MDIKGFLFNLFKPAAPSGYVNLPFQVDVSGPNTSVSVAAPILVGDSGSGGSPGLAPAPAAGDAAANKVLTANGGWSNLSGAALGFPQNTPVPRGYTGSSNNSGSPITVSFPGGSAAGDDALVFVATNYTPTTPSGWTLQTRLSNAFGWQIYIYRKTLSSGDIATGSVSIAATTGSGFFKAAAGCITFTGALGGIRDFQQAEISQGTSTTQTVSTNTSPIAGDLALYFGTNFLDFGSVSQTVSRGTNQVSNATMGGSDWAALLNTEVLGASGSVSATFTTGSGSVNNGAYGGVLVVYGLGNANLMSNPMTTKGDLIVADTGGAPHRNAVGSDGQVLTADSTHPLGVKWGPAGGGVMGASGGSHSAGLAPDPGSSAGSTKFLREDATWAVPAGGGGSAPAYTQPSTAVPTVASLTAMNQSTATAVDSAAGIFMHQTSGATQYIFALTQSVPGSTPYTFTVAMIPNIPASNFASGGICISDGTKLITFGFQYSGGALVWVVTKWNSATSYNSDYSSLPTFPRFLFPSPVIWLRYVDNGTTRKYQWSYDGANFLDVRTGDARTDFLTATKLGINVTCNGASDVYATFSSWAVT